MADQKDPKEQAFLQSALSLPGMKLYANGFIVARTASDIVVVLLHNGIHIGVLNLSYISARTLSEELANGVVHFEKAMEQNVPSINDVSKKYNENRGPQDDVG